MKKNLKIEEEFLTDEMMKTFYPEQGKVLAQKCSIKERSVAKIVINNRKAASIGLKSMYSIN